MKNKLIEIGREHWPALRNLYTANSPEFFGYVLVDTFIRWTEQQPNNLPEVKLYSLNGDWSDGTYAAIVSHQTRPQPHATLIVFNLFILTCAVHRFVVLLFVGGHKPSFTRTLGLD